MEASSEGHKEVVAWLIHQGVEINVLSEDQDTALTLACQGGFQEVADILIKAGREREILTTMTIQR